MGEKERRLSVVKCWTDRLELLCDCFQPPENRQEFGNATNKTGDLVWSECETVREPTFAPNGGDSFSF